MTIDLIATCAACGDTADADAEGICPGCGTQRACAPRCWPHLHSGRLPVSRHYADLSRFDLGTVRTTTVATPTPAWRNGPPFCSANHIHGRDTTGCVMVAGHPGPVHRYAAGATFTLGVAPTVEHVEVLRWLVEAGPATVFPADYEPAEDLVSCGLLRRGALRRADSDEPGRWYFLNGGRHLPPTLGMSYLLLNEFIDPEHEVAYLLRATLDAATPDGTAPVAAAIADVIRQTSQPAATILRAARRIAARDYLATEACTHLVIGEVHDLLNQTDNGPHLIVEQVYDPCVLAQAIRSLAVDNLPAFADGFAAEAQATIARGAGRFWIAGYRIPNRSVAAAACEAINDNEGLPGHRFMVIPDPREPEVTE